LATLEAADDPEPPVLTERNGLEEREREREREIEKERERPQTTTTEEEEARGRGEGGLPTFKIQTSRSWSFVCRTLPLH
jgi:hypothetical protein